jgi:hypothetical protein
VTGGLTALWAVLMLRGAPRMIVLGGGALILGAVGGLVWRVGRELRAARATHYALTSERVLVLAPGRVVSSVPVEACEHLQLRFHRKGVGDVIPGAGPALVHVPHAEQVYKLLAESCRRQRLGGPGGAPPPALGGPSGPPGAAD